MAEPRSPGNRRSVGFWDARAAHRAHCVTMTRPRVTRYGADRLRVGSWRGDDTAALVTPAAGWPAPTADGLAACLQELRELGYVSFVTSALTVDECEPFLEAGFTVRERLELLSHDLEDIPSGTAGAHSTEATPPARVRRARRRDRPSVLSVDHLAFDSFWRLDEPGLRDALTATPTRRFRVAVDRGLVGYAITGRNRERAYLQRLAVHPRAQHGGIGTTLIVDALRWVRSHGGASMLVNTQERNERALSLYERLGFERRPEGLAVLTRAERVPA